MVMRIPGGSEDILQHAAREAESEKSHLAHRAQSGVPFTWLYKIYLFDQVSLSSNCPS